MAWWETGNGDEIGDQPADLVGQRLTRLAEERRAAGLPPCTPARLLAALAAVLGEAVGTPGLVLITVDAQGARTDYPAVGEERLAQALRELVAGLVQCYMRYLGRTPRLNEVCAVFAFVLRHAPERFLDQAEGWRLRQLAVSDPSLARRRLPAAGAGGAEGS